MGSERSARRRCVCEREGVDQPNAQRAQRAEGKQSAVPLLEERGLAFFCLPAFKAPFLNAGLARVATIRGLYAT